MPTPGDRKARPILIFILIVVSMSLLLMLYLAVQEAKNHQDWHSLLESLPHHFSYQWDVAVSAYSQIRVIL